eukprot:IDg12962t1
MSSSILTETNKDIIVPESSSNFLNILFGSWSIRFLKDTSLTVDDATGTFTTSPTAYKRSGKFVGSNFAATTPRGRSRMKTQEGHFSGGSLDTHYSFVFIAAFQRHRLSKTAMRIKSVVFSFLRRLSKTVVRLFSKDIKFFAGTFYFGWPLGRLWHSEDPTGLKLIRY